MIDWRIRVEGQNWIGGQIRFGWRSYIVGESGLGLSCKAWTFSEWMDTVSVEDEMIGSDQVMVLGEMGP